MYCFFKKFEIKRFSRDFVITSNYGRSELTSVDYDCTASHFAKIITTPSSNINFVLLCFQYYLFYRYILHGRILLASAEKIFTPLFKRLWVWTAE